jgi:hypothetical protein
MVPEPRQDVRRIGRERFAETEFQSRQRETQIDPDRVSK